jgi:threonine dehydratase
MISALDIIAARQRLAPYVRSTPLRASDWLSAATHATVYLKLESTQVTNSFKLRGAFNAALRVLEEVGGDPARAPRLVTASAGNHGRALALACKTLGLRAVVFIPNTAPETKKSAIRGHGVELYDQLANYDEAEHAARHFAATNDGLFISPYNHPDVIAGAGTIALEICEALPAIDALIVPLGGGGLASGLGIALKAASPQTEIIAVETAASTPFVASLAAGHIVEIDAGESIADGLTGNLEPGSVTFDIVRRVVDQVVTVDEDQIIGAIRGIASEEHLIAEGAGAVATAAVLAKALIARDHVAVVMVTGANIDEARLRRCLSES